MNYSVRMFRARCVHAADCNSNVINRWICARCKFNYIKVIRQCLWVCRQFLSKQFLNLCLLNSWHYNRFNAILCCVRCNTYMKCVRFRKLVVFSNVCVSLSIQVFCLYTFQQQGTTYFSYTCVNTRVEILWFSTSVHWFMALRACRMFREYVILMLVFFLLISHLLLLQHIFSFSDFSPHFLQLI